MSFKSSTGRDITGKEIKVLSSSQIGLGLGGGTTLVERAIVGVCTLTEDDSSGARYTSSLFTISADVVVAGIPSATQAVKAIVTGNIQQQIVLSSVSAVASVNQNFSGGNLALGGPNNEGNGTLGDIFNSGSNPATTNKTGDNASTQFIYTFPSGVRIYGDEYRINGGLQSNQGGGGSLTNIDGNEIGCFNTTVDKSNTTFTRKIEKFKMSSNYLNAGGNTYYTFANNITIDGVVLQDGQSYEFITFTNNTSFSRLEIGDTITQATTGATAKVGEIDSGNSRIYIYKKTGSWDTSNGYAVTGPYREDLGSVTRYATIGATGNITDIVDSDPGFVIQTNGGLPDDLIDLVFPSTFATSGLAPDTQLTSGTTITGVMKFENPFGFQEIQTNTITPT